MKETRLMMDMPVTIEAVDQRVTKVDLNKIYDYFDYIDRTFSTYKSDSEISLINRGMLREDQYSQDMRTIFGLSEKTKNETKGYFNIRNNNYYDPSGIVKGWAIFQAALILKNLDLNNFYLDVGGDIQVSGHNASGRNWTVGIKNPFNPKEIVKAVQIREEGVATSGTYIRGQHIYNPFQPAQKITEIVSLTVIGPNIYEADRFATAAFAMGKKGIDFIEKIKGFEGYQIDAEGIATYTSGFDAYVI